MRIPGLLLLVVCSLLHTHASAQLLPNPGPEVPVSAVMITAAPLDQAPSVADSNGQIALLAWEDRRSGAAVTYAARIDQDGVVLDPLGIRIGQGVPKAVAWTEFGFVLLLERPVLHELVTISAAGAIVNRRALEAEEPFAGSIDGTHTRFLFLEAGRRFSGESFLQGVLVDPLGTGTEPVIRRIELPGAPAGLVDEEWLTASDGTDILVLRHQRRESGPSPDRIVADRISAEGDIISSTVTGLAITLDAADQLEGNIDGYVLVRHSRPEAREIRSFRLTGAGLYTGETDTLGPPVPPANTEIGLIRDGTRYLFAWWAPESQQTVARSYVAQVTTTGQFGGPELVGDWQGHVSGLVLASEAGHRVLFHGVRQRIGSSSFDVLATTLSAPLGVSTQTLVTQSATLQSEVRVAVSRSGYMAGWGENGPDRLARAFVRRFSAGGLADDTVPREVYAIEQNTQTLRLPKVRVAATANAYVAVWATTDGLYARRIGSIGGDWLDATPIQVAGSAAEFDVVTNGTNALIVWTSECAADARCVMSRRLAMSGDPALTHSETISGRGFNYEVAAGTDGDSFLVAWVEGRRDCVVTCGFDPYSVLAARVGSDGNVIDGQPIAVEQRKTFAEKPAVAFDGEDYVVLWASWSQGWSTRGARVTGDGAVLETDASGNGVSVDGGMASFSTQPVIARMGDQLVLMSRRAEVVERLPVYVWTATTFPARTPLADVRSLPRQEMFRQDSEIFGTVHAAHSSQGLLYVGYDRIAEGMYAGAPRAFVTRFGSIQSGRRRSVVR